MAKSLLARVDGEVVAKDIERLLRDAEGAAVGGGAHHARICQAVHHALDPGVHGAGLDDLVADEPPLRAVPFPPAVLLDRLAPDAVPPRPAPPAVGGAPED